MNYWLKKRSCIFKKVLMMWKRFQDICQEVLFYRLTLVHNKKAASELRNQAGDMFRCKKVKGEHPSPFLFNAIRLKPCYNLLFSAV
jgi:hypothetical protein